MTYPTINSVELTTATDVSSVTLSYPASYSVGDLLLVAVTEGSVSNSSLDNISPSLPSGWTLLDSLDLYQSDNPGNVLRTFYRFADGNEASYPINVTYSLNASVCAYVFAISDVGALDAATYGRFRGAALSLNWDSYTLNTADDYLQIALSGWWNDGESVLSHPFSSTNTDSAVSSVTQDKAVGLFYAAENHNGGMSTQQTASLSSTENYGSYYVVVYGEGPRNIKHDHLLDVPSVTDPNKQTVYSHGFEDNTLGSFTTSGTTGWVTNSSGTSSSNTGPSSAQSGTYYVYVETSSGNSYASGDTDYLTYENLSNEQLTAVEFWYHQYGTDQGTLHLEEEGPVGTWTSVWSSTGDQGNQWNTANVPVNTTNGVRFRNVAAGSFAGDVALDVITIFGAGSGGGGGGTETVSPNGVIHSHTLDAPSVTDPNNISYDDEVSADSPIWHLPLDGNFTALVGTSATGTWSNASAIVEGTTAAYNANGGERDVANQGSINTSGPWSAKTHEMWFRANSLSGRQAMYEQGGGTRGILFYTDGTDFRVSIWNDAADGPDTPWEFWLSGGTIQTGTDYHAVITWSEANDRAILYLNGAEVARHTGVMGQLYNHSGDISLVPASADSKIVDGGAVPGGFDGAIAQIAQYNSELSATRVSDHYNAGIPAATIVAPDALTHTHTLEQPSVSFIPGTVSVSVDHSDHVHVLDAATVIDGNASTYANGYSYRKPVTIDHTRVSGTTAHTNFPVLIDITDADLAAKVVDGTYLDIRFEDTNGVQLDHEVEVWNGSTGRLRAWIKVPSLATGTDTVINLYYGNSTLSSDEENSAATWSDYIAVWHLNDLTSATNTHTLTSVGSPTFSDKLTLDGSSYLSLANGHTLVDGYSALTVQVIANADTIGHDRGVLGFQNFSGGDDSIGFRWDTGGWAGGGTEVIKGSMATSSGTAPFETTSNVTTAGQDVSLHMTWEAGSAPLMYLDGAALGFTAAPASLTGTVDARDGEFRIGDMSKSSAGQWDGTIDEVRLRATALSADWIATEHENFINTSSFTTLGAEEQATASVVAVDPADATHSHTLDQSSVSFIPATVSVSVDNLDHAHTLDEAPTIDGNVGVYVNGYSYRKTVTIDNTKVSGTTAHTNFPVLISVTDSDLASRVIDGAHLDIRFEQTNGTKLDHEISRFDGSTGELIAWVRIPSLATGSDTQIWMYYGNSSLSSSEENANGVWQDYSAVWHLDETSSGTGTTGVYKDSTGNGNDGTDHVGSAQSSNPKIGDAVALDGVDDYIDTGMAWSGGPVTVTFWNNVASADTQNSFGFGSDVSAETDRFQCHAPWSNNSIYFDYGDNSGAGRVFTDYTSYLNKWTHVTMRSGGGTGGQAILLDGSVATSKAGSDNPVASTNFHIGKSANGTGAFHPGAIDEFRVYPGELSDDWIATEYANQNNPGTFTTLGTEEQATSVVTVDPVDVTHSHTADSPSIALTLYGESGLVTSASCDGTGSFVRIADTSFTAVATTTIDGNYAREGNSDLSASVAVNASAENLALADTSLVAEASTNIVGSSAEDNEANLSASATTDVDTVKELAGEASVSGQANSTQSGVVVLSADTILAGQVDQTAQGQDYDLGQFSGSVESVLQADATHVKALSTSLLSEAGSSSNAENFCFASMAVYGVTTAIEDSTVIVGGAANINTDSDMSKPELILSYIAVPGQAVARGYLQASAEVARKKVRVRKKPISPTRASMMR